MALEITVPVLGESVTEATVAKWLKKVGDAVALDEPLLELETDKVTLEVNATQAGTLAEIVAGEGDTVEVGALLGTLSDGAGAPAAKPAPKAEAAPAPAPAPAPDPLDHGGPGPGGPHRPGVLRLLRQRIWREDVQRRDERRVDARRHADGAVDAERLHASTLARNDPGLLVRNDPLS